MVFSEEIANAYKLYQLLLFHFQEKRVDEFFELIEENMSKVNHYFQTVFRTFLRHKQYIKNALETDYSNAKLEATNKLIKDIKRLGFGFRNFINFKKRVFIILNIVKTTRENGWLALRLKASATGRGLKAYRMVSLQHHLC